MPSIYWLLIDSSTLQTFYHLCHLGRYKICMYEYCSFPFTFFKIIFIGDITATGSPVRQVLPPFSFPAAPSSTIFRLSFIFSGLVTPGMSGRFIGGVLDKGEARHFNKKERSYIIRVPAIYIKSLGTVQQCSSKFMRRVKVILPSPTKHRKEHKGAYLFVNTRISTTRDQFTWHKLST